MLKLRFFGAGGAVFCGQPLPGFPNQQPYLLLCYLLLHPHYPHAREGLASLFWEEYPTSVSRKYLRNSLWKLRQVFETAGAELDDFLLVGDESISLITTSPYWLDVQEFEEKILHCQDISGYTLQPAQAAELEQAVDLYHGSLLDGVYEDWCLNERERLDLLFLNALGKLISYHERRGSYERGLLYGERLLAHDNTREQVHVQMMRLFWLIGDRNAALNQYRRCEQILHGELGIAPMRETVSLYQQMASNSYAPGQNSPDPAESAMLRLQQLKRTIEEASAELKQIESMMGKGVLKPGPV